MIPAPGEISWVAEAPPTGRAQGMVLTVAVPCRAHSWPADSFLAEPEVTEDSLGSASCTERLGLVL